MKLIIRIIIAFFAVFSALAPSCPHKKPPEYYFATGKREYGEKDYKDAYKYLTRAIKLNPDYLEAIWMRANLKMEMDSFASAIKDFSRVIELKKSGDAFYLRANAKWKLADSLGACLDWQTACDLNMNRACDMIRKNCK